MTRHDLGPHIPGAPFCDWLHHQAGLLEADGTLPNPGGRIDGKSPALSILADRLGVVPRTLWRYMHGRDGNDAMSDTFRRWRVEDMLTRADVDFYDVYPEFEHERDIELEADGWCKCCREFVTPIFGLCPWDDTPIHMEMAA